jgi:lysophospholipase L1-like esterase
MTFLMPALLAATSVAACADAPDYAMNPDAGGNTGVFAGGVRWLGRVDVGNPRQPRFSWSGAGFVARFSGTSLTVDLTVSGAAQIFKAVVDGAAEPAFTMPSGPGTHALATGLPAGIHTIELYRQTEGPQGETRLDDVTVGGGALVDPPAASDRLIEVIGDSITCGYGNLGTNADLDATECFTTESHWDTYAAVAARALGAELSTIAASGRGIIRNYDGDTGGTMPMIYDRVLTNAATPTWDFKVAPQAVVINLGTNDISNNKGDPGTAFRDSYTTLLATVRARYPGAYIVCLVAPLLNGGELSTILGHIRAAVGSRVAAGDTRVELFDMIQPQTSDKFACQYHPNIAENMLMAGQLEAELRAKLGW